jgi:hypothetical protein
VLDGDLDAVIQALVDADSAARMSEFSEAPESGAHPEQAGEH